MKFIARLDRPICGWHWPQTVKVESLTSQLSNIDEEEIIPNPI